LSGENHLARVVINYFLSALGFAEINQ